MFSFSILPNFIVQAGIARISLPWILFATLGFVPASAQGQGIERTLPFKGQSVSNTGLFHLGSDTPHVGSEDLLVEPGTKADMQMSGHKKPLPTNNVPEKKAKVGCLLNLDEPQGGPAFWQFRISPFAEMIWVLSFASGYMVFKGVKALNQDMLTTMTICGLVDSAVLLSTVVPLDFGNSLFML